MELNLSSLLKIEKVSNLQYIAYYLTMDAENVNAGVIKVAVEYEEISPFDKNLLKAYAITQKNLGLPIILHTNARNKNALGLSVDDPRA